MSNPVIYITVKGGYVEAYSDTPDIDVYLLDYDGNEIGDWHATDQEIHDIFWEKYDNGELTNIY